MRRMRLAAAIAVAIVAGLFDTRAAAQEPIDQTMTAAIKAEGMRRSEVARLFQSMADVLGPRLTGSPSYVAAARWAVDRFRDWGLANPRREPFEFGRGWSLEKLTAEMISPRYTPLIGYAEAWTPPTSGVLTGTPIYVGDSTVDGRSIDWVKASRRDRAHPSAADRVPPRGPDAAVIAGRRPGADRQPASSRPFERDADAADACAPSRAGAGVVLRPGAMEHGTVRVQGNRDYGGRRRPVDGARGRAVQHAGPAGAGWHPDRAARSKSARGFMPDGNSYNVMAEIPGTDPVLRDEVVLIGAHLDSWHTATGATDNADGAVAAMEAMRILTALRARPRRTIRVALWGGEEQGLLGARAYVARAPVRARPRANKISVYINDDPGHRCDLRVLYAGQRGGQANLRCLAGALARHRDDAKRHRGHRQHRPRAIQRGRRPRLHRDQGLSQLRRPHASHQRGLRGCRQRRGPKAVGRGDGGRRVARCDAGPADPGPRAMMRRTSTTGMSEVSRREFVATGLAAAAWATLPVSAQTPELTSLTLKQASERLRRKETSAVELTEACLARIERHNRAINAFITVTREQAMAAAREMDAELRRGSRRGPLHGIPIALKDNIDTAGVRTTAASGVFKDRVPTEDAEVVARLKTAGGDLLGKLNLHEFALGGTSAVTYFGPVRNPWALDRVAGGSSGGSAAAIAADLCFGTLGTDTGGSIRIPASLCGIVGLKPTYGRVSNRGVMPMAWTLDHVGPMCETVEDAALMLAAIAGYDPLDPTSVDAPMPDYSRAIGMHDVEAARRRRAHAVLRQPQPRRGESGGGGDRRRSRLTARVADVEVPAAGNIADVWNSEIYAYHQPWITKTPELYQEATRNLIQERARPVR